MTPGEEKPCAFNSVYVGAVCAGVLDRSNIGFAKQTYQIDTGLVMKLMRWEQAFSLWYMRFWVSGESFDAQTGGQNLDWYDNMLWGFLSAAMAWADTEAKFL